MSDGASLFNTPLETGGRAMILLAEAFPAAVILDCLVAMDHVVVHTKDFGGPDSLHAASPLRIAEPFARRELVRRALFLFRSRDLVEEVPRESGFAWQAGEAAAPFVECLTTPYHRALRSRAAWTVRTLGAMDDAAISEMLRTRALHAIEQEDRL